MSDLRARASAASSSMPVPSTAPSAAPPPPRAHFNPKSIRALQTFHRLTRPSPLSAEASDQNYRGLINLAGILLVVLNARLAVENMLKYGLRLQLPSDPLSQWPTTWPGLTCALCLPAFGVAAHLVEVAAWRRWIGTRAAALLHVAVIVAAFWLPISVIRVSGANIGSGFILMTLTLVLFMKLVSFAHVSDDARKTRDDKSKLAALDEQVAVAASASAASSASAIAVLSAVSAVSAAGGNATKASISPASAGIVASVADATAAAAAAATPPCYCDAACLGRYRPTLAHTFYFLAAPTLCFQLEYPRSPAVRWRFVLRRLVELLFCLALMVFFSEQYIAPAVQNTLVYMDTMKFVHLFERILKLAVPSLFVWLLMFYALFHAALNLLAELLRFGDRLFYKAWWNASTLEEYWKLWNVPVHSWCVKHLYAPLLRAGATPTMAMFCVFFFSAVMHEVLISVPCHAFYWYGFAAMFGQIPIILLQKVVHRYLPLGTNDWVGNVSFWLTFCIFGQPIVMLLYMHQFAKASTVASA